ncbi:DUF3368 domain-containing protein [Natranaeroarchaeum aerophilus]|uniref:DUF3368 domain-containing protein n=1 Tax=Natranaeroarchaeum aerophilus TaxID=2917711 RepID=A0AAE3FPK3_9EURY|nr:DUF3368 domain-containing protein [Natranaeroarchaeum aerophilus]MCL9813307.1 DUF3368 domain-containing protein [Natranaeroarchaeum aerophilus]
MWVFDATPLIYLAKAERLALIRHLDDPRVIPEQVYEEVVTDGIEAGYTDGRRIEQQVEAGQFDIEAVDMTESQTQLESNPNLSAADAAVLACADIHDGIAVMDETYGRDVATTEGITTRGTAFLVLKFAQSSAISADEARKVIDTMIDEGWYCAPDVYTKIVRKLDSYSEKE